MSINRAKVVVTGGAGFIGSHLVDSLLALDNEVVVVDDFSTGEESNLVHHSGERRLRVERADVMNESKMNELFKGARFVFHLATQNVRRSLRQPTPVHDVNATGTLNVLKAATAAKVEKLLYCSSSEVYGTMVKVPQAEESHFHPETIYGASKLTGEYYTEVFQRSGWLNTVTARPFNSYGPREHYKGFKGEVIPRFILLSLFGEPPVIYGDGSQTRDFTYVTETAECLIKLVSTKACEGRTFNVCYGEEVSIKEIASLVADFTGSKKIPVFHDKRPSDVLRLYGDATLLREVVGWKPQVNISEGLKRTVEWFKNNVALTPELKASFDVRNWAGMEQEPWIPGNRR